MRGVIRVKQYSIRTEEAYVLWYKRYVRFHGLRHPGEMGVSEVSKFLTYLAVERNVSESTQNQAFGVFAFVFKEVPKIGITPEFPED